MYLKLTAYPLTSQPKRLGKMLIHSCLRICSLLQDTISFPLQTFSMFLLCSFSFFFYPFPLSTFLLQLLSITTLSVKFNTQYMWVYYSYLLTFCISSHICIQSCRHWFTSIWCTTVSDVIVCGKKTPLGQN